MIPSRFTMRALLPLFAVLGWTHSIDPSQCFAQLGMEDETIFDHDISASSSFDDKNVGPKHGRIRQEKGGGAWCPQTQATPEANEWIQIDLKSVHMITATETQGRFGNGQGVEFAEAYYLEYWRPRLNKWIRYRDRLNGELVKGNINTYTASKSVLDPPIWASKIRFLPYSKHKRTVCMRVEVYGCKWSEGIVSYSMPQGDKRGANWEFYDNSYDGHWDGEKLQYGLGQLIDGQVAGEDFKQAFYQDNTQGWIGWVNTSRNNKPIEITFEFDKVREFSAVHIYCNNQFEKDVQVFSMAEIFFSIGGKRFKGKPITYDYIEDKIFENPRNVSIKLHHRVGRFVKLRLHFAAKWILISEVTFESFITNGNFSEEEDIEEVPEQLVPFETVNSINVNVKPTNDIQTEGKIIAIILGCFLIILVIVGFVIKVKSRTTPRLSKVPDKPSLYREPSLERLPDGSSDYAEVRESEYAVPLQQQQHSPSAQVFLQNFFPKPPPVPPPPERYYAATEICNQGFQPPPPPTSTPPPVRLTRQPRYVTNSRPYIGP